MSRLWEGSRHELEMALDEIMNRFGRGGLLDFRGFVALMAEPPMSMLLGDASTTGGSPQKKPSSGRGQLVAQIVRETIEIFEHADANSDGKLSELEFWEILPRVFDLMQLPQAHRAGWHGRVTAAYHRVSGSWHTMDFEQYLVSVTPNRK